MNDCENRHVCFKDLDAYIRKDSYFAGLSKTEQEEIIKNLGIISKADVYEIVRTYLESAIIVTYSELYELIQHKELAPGHIYMITDFQTIYQSNVGSTWGTGDHESKVFKIIAQALTNDTLDSNVKVISEDFPNSILWEVKYDPTRKTINSINTKGTITYLKDEHGNSAYYDFKSIQFRITQKELQNVGIETTYPYRDYYTFNSSAKNVSINSGSEQNVFLKNVENVSIGLGCSKNLYNSIVKNTDIKNGVSNLFIKNSIFQEDVSKTIQNAINSPVLYYIDNDTLTVQAYEIDNIY